MHFRIEYKSAEDISILLSRDAVIPLGVLILGDDGDMYVGTGKRISDTLWIDSTIGATLTTAVAAIAALESDMASHGHAIEDITGLQTALDAKAALVHQHTTASITDIDMTGVADGYMLTWDEATSKFVVEEPAAGADLSPYALLDSPTFTGTPSAPTPTAGDDSTKVATTAYVVAAITAVLGAAPAALDTLVELAAAIDNDASFAATMTTALAGKAAVSHTHAVADLSDASANAQSLLQAADYAAMRALLDLEAGTDFYSTGAVDSALSGKAASSHTHTVSDLSDASANGKSLIAAADYETMVGLLGISSGAPDWTYTSPISINGATVWSDIPAGVTQIEVFIRNVYNNNANGVAGIRIGDSGGIETTGYKSSAGGGSTAGFVFYCSSSDDPVHGIIRLSRGDADSYEWFVTGAMRLDGNSTFVHTVNGYKALSDELTQVGMFNATGSITSGTGYIRYK